MRAERWYDVFRRTTSSGSFIPEIDGLRFTAIAAVVVFHVAEILKIKAPGLYGQPEQTLLGSFASRGWVGVEIFFVISGMILGMPFAAHYLRGAKPVQLGEYFVRRVTRLEPPYVLSLLAFFVLYLLAKGLSAAELVPHLGASLLYVHNAVFGEGSLLNDVAWSLEIEIQFYVLAPLLAAVLFRVRNDRLRRLLLTLATVASMAAAWQWVVPGSRAYLSIARFGHFFFIGLLLADLYVTGQLVRDDQRRRWDLIGIVGWPLLFLGWIAWDGAFEAVGGRGPAYVFFVFPFALLVLFMAAFRGGLVRALFRTPVITTVGGMCYSIYLLHNRVLGTVLAKTGKFAPTGIYSVDLALQVAIAVIPVLAISALFFVMIEKPCMRKDWPQRLGRLGLARLGFAKTTSSQTR